ncbi:MAG: PAS domain-containing protein [Syntrophales bacterium]|nr:PAS domain-containing protein [Syntrophales bacterium]
MKTKASKKIDPGTSVKDLKKKEASDSPRESKHLLQSIIHGFSIPAFVIGKDHKVIHWNKALERLSKIPMGEVVGTTEQWRAFYAEERPCMADLLVDGISERILKWYEGKYAKSDLLEEAYEATDFFPDLGESGKWLRFTAAAIRDSKGELVGAVETLEDITDRVAAEKSRRESEQRLCSIIEGSPFPTFIIGLDHRVIYWNRALERLSKIPSEEVIGTSQHWRAFYAEERPCMADLIVNQSLETIPEWYRGVSKSKLLDETFKAEGFFPDLGENGRWLWFIAASIRTSQGILVGAIETLGDFTDTRKERELAAQRLIESENRLSSIFQGFSIPAFAIGKDHKVILWNRALEKLSQIPAAEMIGTNQQWRAFYGQERPCMADLLVDSAVKNISKWYSGKYRYIDVNEESYEATDFFPELGKNGRWLRFTAAVIRDSHGELIGAVETLEDITGQKQAEAALETKVPKKK